MHPKTFLEVVRRHPRYLEGAPPKDSDLPPLEGLGLDSDFESKNFSKKSKENDNF